MVRKWIKGISLTFALFFSFTLNADHIDQLLKRADDIRSSNPATFQEILFELGSQKPSFSPQQHNYYQYLLAYQKSFIGDFASAIQLYKELADGEDIPAEIQLRANMSLVNIYAISKDWNNGLEHLLNAQKAIPNINNLDLLTHINMTNSLFYNQMGQYELGLNYAEKVTKVTQSGRPYCMALMLTAEAKFKLGKLEINNSQHNQTVLACEQAQEPVALAAIYTIEAAQLISNNQYQAALTLLETHQQMVDSTKYPPYLAYFYSLLSQSHLAMGNHLEAQTSAEKTLSLAATLGSSEPEVIANQVLYNLAEQNGDTVNALKYYKQYAEADKAYLDDIKTKHLAFQLAQHRAAEQENSIALLQQQNNLLILKQKITSVEAENNRLFITLLAVSVSVLLLMIFRANTTQKKLRTLAQNDGLTGLFNRRHFTQQANLAIKKCDNQRQVGSCILFDLDKFKSINDTYGHETGDWVLKNVAKQCKAIVRDNDIFARIGGEEFCLFLPNCNLEDAAAIAETYRQQLTEIDTQGSGYEFTISGSFGVSDFTTSGSSLERLIADADAAMYAAKSSGRNKVCLASS
ncbi:diguanylate cyclase [Shewanella maritima]|uniref:tetratricopeptide repeat-containing diguanylate cyclase n=1 Tax=Shewanella maritima TaxID=2520507 RepID=UPI0037352CF7